jgi:threonine dehydratase
MVRALGDGVLTVSEEEMKAAMRFLLTRMKILTEPSGVVAAAAVLHKKLSQKLPRIGIILSGGNVDLDVLAKICEEAV